MKRRKKTERVVCGLYRSAFRAGVMSCLGAGGEIH